MVFVPAHSIWLATGYMFTGRFNMSVLGLILVFRIVVRPQCNGRMHLSVFLCFPCGIILSEHGSVVF